MGPEKTISSYSQTNRDLFGLQRRICVRWQLLGCRLLWTFIFLLTLHNAKESLCKFEERDGKHFPACTPWNYVISKSGPCVNATRSIHFEKAESELFSCRGPASFVVENQSCKCMLDEYRPTIVAPDHVESFSPGTDGCIAEDSVVKQLTSKLTYSSWALAECDLEDVGFELLKCNAATQTRAGVFYWERPCDAILDLPGPVEVPCKVTCPAGEFAKKPTLECDVCPAGTFSIPGTVYGPVWDEEKWPVSFHNFDRGPGIERWHIVDGLLKSNHVMWNSHSKLKFMTTIISPISFLTLNYQIVARESIVSFGIRVNQHSLHLTSAKTESLSDLQLILSNELEICEWKAVSNGTQMCMTSDPYGKEKFKEGAYSGIGVFNPHCDISDFERIVPEGVQNFMFFILANNVHMYSKCDIAHQVTNAALVKGVQGIILGSNVLMNLEAINTTVPVGYAKPNELFRYRSDSVFAFMLKQETRDVEVHTEIELSAHRITVHASSFDDGVYLRSILIHGTQSSAETCTECPPGYASHQGSQQCDICPKNTFADRPGMAWPCQPCPPNTFAPPGSLHCIPMATCGKNDYVAHLTKCLMREGERGDVKYRQKLEYSLIKPPTCNPEVESDFIPDTSREVLCRSCSNGLVRKGGACTPCGVGEIANTKENECTACPHGTYANRMLNYEDFSALEGEFPANWTLECKTCLGPGWHIIPDASNSEDSEVAPRVHIVSGHGFGHDSVAHLDIPVEVQGVGSVTFKYEIIRPVGFAAGDVYGTFTILGEIAGNVSESEDLKVSTNGSPISLHLPLVQEGKGVLRWTWGIANGLSHSSHTKRPTLILYSLSVQGERSGGAYECVDCPPGSQCKAGVITRCPAGTYRSGHMHQCESCPKGLVAERSGHRECTECPIGTVATADGTQCYLAETRLDIYSVWKHVPVKYDLAMLEQRLGPFLMGSLQGQKLVINLTNQFSRSGLQDCGLEVSSPYVCVTSENAGQSDINDPRVGESIASIATVMHSPSSYGDDVTIMVHSKQPCSQNVGSFQQTHITLKCEEDTIFYSQQPTGHVIGNVTSWDNCSAQVTLTSPFLCPFCSSVNCENFRGPCIDGVRRVYFGCERVCRQENGEATSMKRSYREESCSALGKLSGRRNLLGSVILLTLLCMLWLLVIAQYLYISRKQLRSVIAQLNQERVPGDLLFSPVRN